MSKSSTSKPWWSSLGFGSRQPPPDTDYADMGTAFGLDASMPSAPEADKKPAPPEPVRPAGKPPRDGKR